MHPVGCKANLAKLASLTKGLVIVITMDRCAILFLRFKHNGVLCIIGTGSLSSKLSRQYSTVLSLAFGGCKAYAAKGREANRSRSLCSGSAKISKQMPPLARSPSKAPPRPLNGPTGRFQGRAYTWVAYSPSSAPTARISAQHPARLIGTRACTPTHSARVRAREGAWGHTRTRLSEVPPRNFVPKLDSLNYTKIRILLR